MNNVDKQIEPVAKNTAVRLETRQAWEAVRAEGERPSVRRVYTIVGGAWNVVVEECRALRREAAAEGEEIPFGAEPPEGDEEAEDEDALPLAATGKPLSDDLPTRDILEQQLAAAQACAAAALAVRDRLTVERNTADVTLLQRQEQVRTLERRMIENEELLQDELIAARNDRRDADLRIGDLDALLMEQVGIIAQADTAVTTVQEQLQLLAYNDLAQARPSLVEALEQAWSQFEETLRAVLAYDETQHHAAVACGLAEFLDNFPFAVGPGTRVSDPQRGGHGVCNHWAFTKLSAIIDPPSRNIGTPPHISQVQDADPASRPLSWAAYTALQAPRDTAIVHVGAPQRDAANFTNLMIYGIPSVATPIRHPSVSAAAWRQIHASGAPSLMRVGSVRPVQRVRPGSLGEPTAGEALPPVHWAGGVQDDDD